MPHYRHTTRSQKEVFLALTQLEHSHLYNLVDTVTITGPFDIARMRKAVDQLVAEVPSLHTNPLYHEGDIVLAQRGNSTALEYLDLSQDPEGERKAQALIEACLTHDFDIQHDVLSHFIVIRQRDDQWLFIEYGSHVLLDGYTHALVYNRLVDLYNGCADDASSTFDPFDALIASEQAYIGSDHYARDRAYWRTYCEALPPPLRLSLQEATVGPQLRHRRFLDPSLVERLRQLASTYNLRISTLMLALFGLFLSKLSGQEAFRVGLPVAARLDKASRKAPGMVSTILPFGFSVAHDASLAQLARSINHTLRRHLIHQRYHAEEMVRDIPPEQRTHALFHTTLNVISHEQDRCFEGCKVSFKNESNGYTANLAFDLFDRNPDGALEFGITANSHLYNDAMLAQYHERFMLLIARVLEAPDRPFSAYSLLTEAEWQAHEARAARPARRFETFNEAFAQHVARTPEALAVSAGDATLTYAELAERAQRLAAHLAAKGIGHHDLVGVMLPRGIDWLVSIVGLYHLGATYLPLHDELPDERLRFMLTDAKASLVITRDVARMEALSPQTPIVRFADETFDDAPLTDATALTPATGAYLIYTSGSTGQPKGVLVPHEGIMDEFHAMQRASGIQPGDRMLQCSAMSFDVSCLEFTLALAAGAGLVITDHRVITGESDALNAFLTRHDVTHLFMTPAVLGCHDARALPSRVTLFLTGEATPTALLERFAHCKQLINLYGPSEATVISINPQYSSQNTALGTVIDTMQGYVLDAHRQLMPPGSSGELYVAGSGLATGYVNQPALTERSFVPDLFRPDRRMYATGDRVYQDDRGQLFYLGRKDNQVKLRGQRIELGEIRSALLACPGIEDAHVMIEAHEALGQILVGYLCIQEGCSSAPESLKRQLKRTLPTYMVPTFLHTLDALPLTANGKLDRQRLSECIRQDASNAATLDEAPASPIEAAICDVFATVLQTSTPVGPNQDFYMLGGHSLLAFKVIHQVQQHFGVELSIADLMSSPTPRAIAEQLADHHQQDALTPLLKLRPGAAGAPPIFCMNIGSGIGWPYAGLLPYFPVEWPVYAFQSASLKDADYDPASIDEIAEHHIERMRAIWPDGPYHLVGWSFGGQIAHKVAARLQQKGYKVESLVIIDSYPTQSEGLMHQQLNKQDPGVERLVRAILNQDVSTLEDWDKAVNERFNVSLSTHGSLLDTLIRELNKSMSLMDTYTASHYQGDILFIEGRKDEYRDATQVPEAWRPHVSGNINVEYIDFLHESLMNPEALALYAPTMTQHIALRMS